MRLDLHILPIGFTALLALCALQAVALFRHGAPIGADLLSLLPQTTHDPVQAEAQSRLEQAFSRRMLFLVGAGEHDAAIKAAGELAARFSASGLFEKVDGQLAANQDSARDFVLAHRFLLLNSAQRGQLQSADGAAVYLRELARSLYSPLGARGATTIADDPLRFAANELAQLAPATNLEPDPDSGVLLTEDGDTTWVLLTADSTRGAFDLDLPQNIAALLEAIRADWQRPNGYQLLASGGALYAAAARTQAEFEMSTVGWGSLLATMALVLWVFREWRGLLVVIPVFTGSLAAFVITARIFGQVHALTLVFGASLVGVAVDYALHYQVEAFHLRERWRPWPALTMVLPALTLGMLTSIIGYLALAIAPFPGLRQVAVFSSVGLAVAYLTVVCWFPLLLPRFGRKHTPSLLILGEWMLALRGRLSAKRAWLAAALFAAIFLPGLLRVELRDDLRAFQTPNPALYASDQKVRALTGYVPASQFFLVEGRDADQVLERQQQLARALDGEVRAGRLSGYRALGSILPSRAQQQANRDLLGRGLLSDDQRPALLELGLSAELIERERAQFASDSAPISVESFLAAPLGASFAPLWLGTTERGVAGIVSLEGASDPTSLAALADAANGVRFVDRVGAISSLMADTSRTAFGLSAIGCTVMWALLALRYGMGGALQVIAPPTAAVFGAMASFAYCGAALNVFAAFGLVLVLAIGVDYAIFFREAGDHPVATMLGVMLDALTTLLSFGLLVVSKTPAVRSFGLAVTLGILWSFVLAPWAGKAQPAVKIRS